jgi:hypothetical protein
MRCPTCKREVGDPTEECPRCGTELKILFELLKNAEYEFKRGCHFLRSCEYQKAHDSFLKSNRIKHTKRAEYGLTVSSTGLGNISATLSILRRELSRNA